MVESADSKSRFKIHILERGTKYTEKIEIDEDNELEYFHVPAHITMSLKAIIFMTLKM